MLAMIVENFAARPARSGIAHRPEIVRCRNADDPAFGKASNLLPQIERFVIGVVDGRSQPVGIEPPILCQQRPCMVDRLLLEIVAKTEISQHFKKGMMPRCIADIVQIIMLAACADAFLA